MRINKYLVSDTMISKTQREDVLEFARTFALVDDLDNASFLITGATGLVGSSLIRCLLALDKGIRIIAPVRNMERASAMFDDLFSRIEWVECDLMVYDYSQIGNVDFIVHCASPTNGKYVEQHPVETYEFAVESTRNLLRHSQNHRIQSMVYVSSLEVYGENHDEIKIDENMQFYINSQSPRSAYPLGKLVAEYLCTINAIEYKVPVKSVRLTQTFGAGISKEDNRVFAQFARSIISGSDIVLHTMGLSAKPYCYVTDAISALLFVLMRGRDGEVYNVANESSYISIKDLAFFLRDVFNPQIGVRIELSDNMGYAPMTKLDLSTEKLRGLGWSPRFGLAQMFDRLIGYLKEN